LSGHDGECGRKRYEAKPNKAPAKPNEIQAKRNEAERNRRLRVGSHKPLICIVILNRPLRRLLSFQPVGRASRREARFAARKRRRAADATALRATNHDTDDSDFQEEIGRLSRT
jgi:hypothetical protein